MSKRLWSVLQLWRLRLEGPIATPSPPALEARGQGDGIGVEGDVRDRHNHLVVAEDFEMSVSSEAGSRSPFPGRLETLNCA